MFLIFRSDAREGQRSHAAPNSPKRPSRCSSRRLLFTRPTVSGAPPPTNPGPMGMIRCPGRPVGSRGVWRGRLPPHVRLGNGRPARRPSPAIRPRQWLHSRLAGQRASVSNGSVFVNTAVRGCRGASASVSNGCVFVNTAVRGCRGSLVRRSFRISGGPFGAIVCDFRVSRRHGWISEG